MSTARRLAVALCALAALAASSCQRGEGDFDPTPRANLEALWGIIDRQYCFLDYKERELGISWDSIRLEYAARLTPQMTRAQLFEVLCQMLSELRDGHVNLYSSLDVGRNWSWREDYPENLDTELRDRYLGTSYHIGGGLKYRILPDNIAYVVCESFSSGFGEGNLDDMMYFLRLTRGMVLDIRGNSGGLLTYAERLSRRFTNERRLVGYTCHKTGPGRSQFSRPEPEYVDPSGGLRWQKRVVLLTNRSCYSAANTFARNMREMPLVTLMGDQTGGGSGLPMSSELPIGWAVRFSACPSLDARMEHTEFGVQPDVPAALDSALMARGVDSMIERARDFLRRPAGPD